MTSREVNSIVRYVNDMRAMSVRETCLKQREREARESSARDASVIAITIPSSFVHNPTVNLNSFDGRLDRLCTARRMIDALVLVYGFTSIKEEKSQQRNSENRAVDENNPAGGTRTSALACQCCESPAVGSTALRDANFTDSI